MTTKNSKFIEVLKGTTNALINTDLIERIEYYSNYQSVIYTSNATTFVDVPYDELVRLILTGNAKETLNG